MVNVEIVSHKENFLLRLRDNGRFETHSDLVFRVKTRTYVGRVVLPAGLSIKRPKPRRARAALLRRGLLFIDHKKELSRSQIDAAYCAALRLEGVRGWKVFAERIALAALGFMRYQWRYPRVPKGPQRASEDRSGEESRERQHT